MLLKKAPGFQRWRTKIQTNQLASEISSILLQRHNWSQLLRDLNLSSKLTSPLFLQILRTVQTNPDMALQFFHWTKANLGFEPDLKSNSHLIKISLGSGLSSTAKPILDNLVHKYPSWALVDSMLEACRGSDSQSQCLSFVLETYGKKGLFREGLHVFDKMRVHGFSPSVSACNELLNVLHCKNKIRLAWCFCGAMVQTGVSPNQYTWSLIARILGKNGKPERVSMILEMVIYSSEIYETLINCLSKNGSFEAAFVRLNEMRDKKLDLGFSAFSSILDGACRHENPKVIDRTMNIMIKTGLIPEAPLHKYDALIEKLCGLGRSYAAEMFFLEALGEEIPLDDTTYGHMLRALSIIGRRDKAIWVYRLTSKKGVALDENTCNVFSRVVLEEERCDDVSDVLLDIVRRGFVPRDSELSRFLGVLCRERKWEEAEELVHAILDKGLMPDSFCCGLLVEHFCSSRRIDLAMALHNKMERLDLSLDVTTYNVLLNRLVAATRVEEAVWVFDHMRRHDRLSSEGFVVMIKALSRVNERRMAMKLHDEMLKVGLKPDVSTYRRLILVFK